MSQLTVYVLFIVGVLLFGLLYTYKIGRAQKDYRYDTGVSERIQAHPVSLNPIFLTYIIAIVLAIALVVYAAFRGGVG